MTAVADDARQCVVVDTICVPSGRCAAAYPSGTLGDSPAAIAEVAIDEHLRYPEWKEKAIAAGDADIAAGRTLTTEQVLAGISRQRAARGRKSKKTRS